MIFFGKSKVATPAPRQIMIFCPLRYCQAPQALPRQNGAYKNIEKSNYISLTKYAGKKSTSRIPNQYNYILYYVYFSYML
jgi:hypothetical protein